MQPGNFVFEFVDGETAIGRPIDCGGNNFWLAVIFSYDTNGVPNSQLYKPPTAFFVPDDGSTNHSALLAAIQKSYGKQLIENEIKRVAYVRNGDSPLTHEELIEYLDNYGQAVTP